MLFNPLEPAYRHDPYPYYHALRAADPVHRSELFQAWVLSRHADVWNVLRDPRFSVDRRHIDPVRSSPLPQIAAEFSELSDALRRVMMFLDPPDHTRMRRLVGRAFVQVGMKNRQASVQRHVDELLAGAAGRGEVDFVEAFAYPLPVIVIAEILGVPPSQRAAFKAWSDSLGALLDPFVPPAVFERALDSAREMHRFFAAQFAERRAHPRDDLISALVAAEDAGGRLTESELFSTCALLLGAGHLTTTNLLGNALWALTANPDQRRRLESRPELIGTAVEEFLRYDGPLQATARIALERCPIGDRTIEKGDFVILLLGAANRDPAEFHDPDRLDVGRPDNRHVTFGGGMHHCLGADLARLNSQISLTTLLRRYRNWTVTADTPDLKPNLVSRGPASLPLALGAPHR
jgi:cytochrome P450